MRKELERLPWGTEPAEVAALLDRDGALIMTGALTAAQVASINADLDGPFDALSQGNNTDERYQMMSEFLGYKTKRLAHTLRHSKVWREEYLASPILKGYVDAMVPGTGGSHSYSSSQTIESHPGQTSQFLHRDGEYFLKSLSKNAPGGPEMLVLNLVALTDATEDMGATRVLVGSHRWEDYTVPGNPDNTCAAELKAGDLLFYSGRVLHGGGSNITTDKVRRVISGGYLPGFIMGEEAWPFAFTWDEVRTYPKAVQEGMGFRSVSFSGEEPGFLWRAYGKPLEEVFEERDTVSAETALV